jgi:hypothetical protein
MDTIGPRPEGDLNALEQRLGRWRPAPGVLDRDRLMFEAGLASARGASWGRLGFATAACWALAAFALGGLLAHERGRRQALETALALRSNAPNPTPAPVPAPPWQPPRATESPSPDSYLALARRMLVAGPDDLTSAAANHSPDHPPGPAEPPLSPLRARGPGRALDF